jgi:hypothetical protein
MGVLLTRVREPSDQVRHPSEGGGQAPPRHTLLFPVGVLCTYGSTPASGVPPRYGTAPPNRCSRTLSPRDPISSTVDPRDVDLEENPFA